MIRRSGRNAKDPGWLIDRFADPLDPLLTVLLESTDTGILAIDRSGRTIRANRWLHRMTGSTPGLTPGAHAIEIFAPDQARIVSDLLGRVTRGEDARTPLHTRILAPASVGETPVALTIQPLRESNRAISGLLLRFLDRSAEDALEQRLAAARPLQQIGQFAAGIAHDFNNILTAIIGSAEDALALDNLTPEVADALRQVRTAGDRGSALVRQILAYARRQALRPQVLAVNAAIRDLTGLLTRLLGADHRLDLRLEEPGRHVLADPTQFEQVIVNLVANARDAMPAGGVVTVETGHRTLYQPVTDGQEAIPAGRYVVIEVRDTGIGIPAEVLPRIFEPFFTTRNGTGGNGLGLSMVQGIVRQSGGFLTVDSMAGQGTAMRVHLPRHIPAPIASERIAAPSVSSLRGSVEPHDRKAPRGAGCVLLVDDEEPVRRVAERALRRVGWEVCGVGSAEEALAQASAGSPTRFDMLITDVAMPGMSGTALLEAVRRIRPGLPAVLVSGYADSALRDDVLRRGAVFLAKPYGMKELLSATAQAADRGADRVEAPADVLK
ncbi:MAG: ATP-binding protein [Acetobacteraceae bacterium]